VVVLEPAVDALVVVDDTAVHPQLHSAELPAARDPVARLLDPHLGDVADPQAVVGGVVDRHAVGVAVAALEVVV
jgi:hypothetical protein